MLYDWKGVHDEDKINESKDKVVKIIIWANLVMDIVSTVIDLMIQICRFDRAAAVANQCTLHAK